MSGRSILVLSSDEVRDVSSRLSVPQLLETVHSALRSFSQSPQTTQAPHRSIIQSENYTTLFMPSRIESISTTCVKVVAVPKHAGSGGLPATTLVMDESTGCVDAVVNARGLTALRTAAGKKCRLCRLTSSENLKASLLATRYCLGLNASPTHLLLFGAGAQAHAHAAVLIAAYPQIRHCTVINRSYNNRLASLLDQFRAQFPGVDIVGLAADTVPHGQSNVDIQNAVKSASIICTATSSTVPLFPAEWVAPGTHINLIGSFTPLMHEVSTSLIERAKLVLVDARAACAKEAGELIDAGYPIENAIELGELGNEAELIGSDSSQAITIFKSVGVSIMDAAIADLVIWKAREVGSGTSIPYD
jgi:ornithine cyclodeaminase/alanine dehydrogenase-like protein (mu-crystallin family)